MMKWALLAGVIFAFLFKLGFWGFILGFIVGIFVYRFVMKKLDTPPLAEEQKLYCEVLFGALGHLFFIKGGITEDDRDFYIIVINQLRLTDEEKQIAEKAFAHGQDKNYPIQNRLKALYAKYRFRFNARKVFLSIMVRAAWNDNKIDNLEQRVLLTVARGLKLGTFRLNMMISTMDKNRQRQRQRYKNSEGKAIGKKQALEEAYALLGITQEADDDTIKRAYRKLMNENHPDKLISKGATEEELAAAKKKAQQLQTAYDLIKQERKSTQ